MTIWEIESQVIEVLVVVIPMIMTNKAKVPSGHPTKADYLEEMLLMEEVETLPVGPPYSSPPGQMDQWAHLDHKVYKEFLVPLDLQLMLYCPPQEWMPT